MFVKASDTALIIVEKVSYWRKVVGGEKGRTVCTSQGSSLMAGSSTQYNGRKFRLIIQPATLLRIFQFFSSGNNLREGSSVGIIGLALNLAP